MLDLTLFRNSAFNVALASNVQNVFVSFGSFILISQYLQLVLGLSPLQAGLLSLPASLLAIAGPMLSPMVVQRIGTPLTVASDGGAGLLVGVVLVLAAVAAGAAYLVPQVALADRDRG
jgi:DHA2 family multidrug resistance protein-like MFS transporter